MKKLTKIAIALMAIGAAAAGAALYFKKFGGCKCCSEEGECGCGCDGDEEDQDEEDSSFDSREYVSIQPKGKKSSEEDDSGKDTEKPAASEEATAEKNTAGEEAPTEN